MPRLSFRQITPCLNARSAALLSGATPSTSANLHRCFSAWRIFRHTFASMKAESGRVSPYQLQQWLGHKDIKTTQIYVHMSEEYAKKAMEATSL